LTVSARLIYRAWPDARPQDATEVDRRTLAFVAASLRARPTPLSMTRPRLPGLSPRRPLVVDSDRDKRWMKAAAAETTGWRMYVAALPLARWP
jgi:hypothetical protein